MPASDSLENSAVYKFIIEKKYRLYRHLLFIVIMLIVAMGFFVTPRLSLEYFYGDIYLLLFFPALLILAGCYCNRYVLIPHVLLKEKYFLYGVYSTSIVLMIMGLGYGVDYYISQKYDVISPYSLFHPDVNILSSVTGDFLMISVTYLGLMVTILIKHWYFAGQYSSQLENRYFQVQLQQLKSQVSPYFLSDTLQVVAGDVRTAPDKASKMLIQLSKFLRYQLYDSKRENVLLSSEIAFLDDFLKLEQFKRKNFTYQIYKEGKLLGVLVPPLIFLPFVEYVIYQIEEPVTGIQLSFMEKQGKLKFICEATRTTICYVSGKDIEELRKQLDLIYKEKYEFDIKYVNSSIIIYLELQLKGFSSGA